MAITIQNYEELTVALDEDTQWRKKEIVDMRTTCFMPNCPPSILRSAFVLCCAHFEGSIKFSSNAYVAFISGQELKHADLRTEISALIIKKQKHVLFGLHDTKK